MSSRIMNLTKSSKIFYSALHCFRWRLHEILSQIVFVPDNCTCAVALTSPEFHFGVFKSCFYTNIEISFD